jgi:HD-GYP domain-containing protein (c-di-GMP phosphodiesterase class II)
MLSQLSTRGTAGSDMMTVQLNQLRVGAVLRAPIYDAQPGRHHLLLLAAGRTLSDAELQALQRRGVKQVLIHRSEYENVVSGGSGSTGAGATRSAPRPTTNRVAAPAAAAPAKPVAPGFRLERDSYLHAIQSPQKLQRDPQRASEFAKSFENNASDAAHIFEEFVDGGRLAPERVAGISDQHLQQLATDLDEFVSRGVQPVARGYPSRHALQTSMLAETIGTLMGLKKDELIDLGVGCILHDTGMLLVPENLHRVDRPLQTAERLELQKHPIYAADLLNRCHHVSHGAKMVVYQMHERINGTGYPRQRQGSQIHPLARIAAVADTYLAMVSPRTFRSGLPPYQAVEKLLFATRQGFFDPAAVRALLHAVSLFPIGSHVRLSDGRTGRVIRGNRDRFAQPVVEVLDLSGTIPTVETIDLSQRSDLLVTAAIDAPQAAEPVGQASTATYAEPEPVN